MVTTDNVYVVYGSIKCDGPDPEYCHVFKDRETAETFVKSALRYNEIMLDDPWTFAENYEILERPLL